MEKLIVPAALEGLSKGLDHIEYFLGKNRFRQRDIQEALLMSEESMVRMIDNAPAGSEMHVSVKKRHGLGRITISAPGPELTPVTSSDIGIDPENSDLGRGSEDMIRSMLLYAFSDKIHYVRKGKYNFIEITSGSPERVFALHTVTALLTALITGLILEAVLADPAKEVLNTFLLSPIESIFTNCLMLATAPTVFFSIVSAVSQYASFSDPGRVSVKVLTGFLITSVFAILTGLGLFSAILPGSEGLLSTVVFQSMVMPSDEVPTFLSTLISIVPSNIIQPFTGMNTVQLIFLALICGIAMGRTGEHTAGLRKATNALYSLCSKAASILVGFIPVATFASTVSMLITVGSSVILSVIELIGVILLGLLTLVIIYILIVALSGRLNPLHFLKKYAPLMLETFFIGSSADAMPKTIRCCKNELGVSPRVYSFSIPFGAIANMDGSCIYLTITGLFLARVCGVDVSLNSLLPLIFTVFVLSIGAPISPGSALLCLTVLLSQMGVNPAAVGILYGVNAILEMLQAVSNTMGDVAITLAVARSENLINMSVYSAPPKRR